MYRCFLILIVGHLTSGMNQPMYYVLPYPGTQSPGQPKTEPRCSCDEMPQHQTPPAVAYKFTKNGDNSEVLLPMRFGQRNAPNCDKSTFQTRSGSQPISSMPKRLLSSLMLMPTSIADTLTSGEMSF